MSAMTKPCLYSMTMTNTQLTNFEVFSMEG